MSKTDSNNLETTSGKGLSRNCLKLIAIGFITVGHFILYCWSALDFEGPVLAHIGISCFIGPPIFMFFISEGFHYTSSRKRYGIRLLIFALITQVIFAISTRNGSWEFNFHSFLLEWNVFFALFIGFLDLCILYSHLKAPVKTLLVCLTLILSYVTATEWAVFGPLMIIAFHSLREHKILRFPAETALCYLTFAFGDCLPGGGFTINWFNLGLLKELIFCMIGIALVSFFYKGRNGRKSAFMKYFFYIAYPLHLLIIDLVIFLAHK